jgi:acetylornithine/N-succinyldiaminopimelate aminotransferase
LVRQLSEGLLGLARRHGLVGERGLGLLRALVLSDARAPSVVAAAQALEPAGLLLNAPRPNLLRFMPALNITEAELETALSMLDEALTRARLPA